MPAGAGEPGPPGHSPCGIYCRTPWWGNFLARRAARPGQAGLAGVAGAGKISPGPGHLFGQRLRFRGVAGTLFAAFGVVEAEGQFGGVPRPGILHHGRLPGEEVGKDRRAVLVVLQFGHPSWLLPGNPEMAGLGKLFWLDFYKYWAPDGAGGGVAPASGLAVPSYRIKRKCDAPPFEPW